jgi:hypothetical protein
LRCKVTNKRAKRKGKIIFSFCYFFLPHHQLILFLAMLSLLRCPFFADRILQTLQTPPLARPKDACKARTPPLEGRGWLRIELCGGQGDSYYPNLFFLFLFVFIGFFSGRFAVSTHIDSGETMSLPSGQHSKLRIYSDMRKNYPKKIIQNG